MGYLPTDVHDQGKFRLQEFLRPSIHKAVARCLLLLTVFSHRKLFYDTLVETQYDTYNPTLCVLNYERHDSAHLAWQCTS